MPVLDKEENDYLVVGSTIEDPHTTERNRSSKRNISRILKKILISRIPYSFTRSCMKQIDTTDVDFGQIR